MRLPSSKNKAQNGHDDANAPFFFFFVFVFTSRQLWKSECSYEENFARVDDGVFVRSFH